MDKKTTTAIYGRFDYTGKAWRAKRKTILRRDGYQCRECRRYGRARDAVEVHHIKPEDEYPELAYEDNVHLHHGEALPTLLHRGGSGARQSGIWRPCEDV